METIKNHLSDLLSHRVLRFALVGIFNTLTNFLILNIAFYKLGVNKIAANIIATCCAMVISFLLNRNFVFAHKGNWIKQLVTFVLVTSIGTLVINNGIYILSLSILSGQISYNISRDLSSLGLKLSQDFIQINLSAVIATLFSLVWNYTGYRLVVFRRIQVSEETA